MSGWDLFAHCQALLAKHEAVIATGSFYWCPDDWISHPIKDFRTVSLIPLEEIMVYDFPVRPFSWGTQKTLAGDKSPGSPTPPQLPVWCCCDYAWLDMIEKLQG